METVKRELDIQSFIGEYPWLLNINYQNIPELQDESSDMEVHIEGNNRIDLILRDVSSGYPVIVEFKKNDLNRDNIGQILEYRARILSFLNKPESILYEIFGNTLSAPKLILVVRSSNQYGRIACHMQNIELFEYGNIMEKIVLNELPSKKSMDDFSLILKSKTPIIDNNRNDYLEKEVYSILKNIFKKYGYENEWKYYNNYDIGEYWQLQDKFLNNWYFKHQKISFGLYEDILIENDLAVCFSYFIPNEDLAVKIKKEILMEKNDYKGIKIRPEPGSPYFMVDVRYDSEHFFNNVENILEYNFQKFLEIYK